MRIVLRVDYRGASVLYSGDTVGRRIGDPAPACKDAEATIVANHQAGLAPLSAFVLIAPHHGADNARSTCFIRAVDPHWVVFSAGHAFEHAREAPAQRYLAHAVAEENLLRTDRGDDEGGRNGREDASRAVRMGEATTTWRSCCSPTGWRGSTTSSLEMDPVAEPSRSGRPELSWQSLEPAKEAGDHGTTSTCVK